jgi:hypothetical protein
MTPIGFMAVNELPRQRHHFLRQDPHLPALLPEALMRSSPAPQPRQRASFSSTRAAMED